MHESDNSDKIKNAQFPYDACGSSADNTYWPTTEKPPGYYEYGWVVQKQAALW